MADRVTQQIEEKNRVTLGRTIHPLAKSSNDRGLAPDSMRLDRLQVRFKRSNTQEAALKQLIDQMHTAGSASYHKWLTPEQFGQRFGPSDGDVAKIEGWLQSHGFAITKLNPGRQTLEFSGTSGQFRDTFHAPIHAYKIDGQTRYANSADPEIPEALAPVFGGFASLNNFPLKSQVKNMGNATYDPATHASKPSWTTQDPYGKTFLLAPGDFAVQYDLNPLYTAATPIKGNGQSIAIVNEANINIALVNRFRSLFNLPANPPQVIIDGNDPGIDGINNPYGPNYASVEAYLDVEWAGAVAPNANIDLVIGADTALESGLALAAERAVYSNIAPIISLSFLGCEFNLGSSNEFWSSLWEQAAAQGITVMVASGDSGSAACDYSGEYAVHGQAVNGLASTPYDVAVGGTDFYYSDYNASASVLNTQIDSFWNAAPSNNVPTVSLLSPIPEQPWNGSQFGLNTFGFSENYSTLASGGGGASTCATGATGTYGNFTSCTAGWPKPAWQTGTGVPSDTVRDIPDISLFASNGYNSSYYPICAYDGDCQPVASDETVQITGVGGTSASSPAFAGIMALVNQKYGRQGQANFVLYPLAMQFPSAFHDVVNGTNSVPCNTTTVTDLYTDVSYAPLDCLPVASPFNLIVDDSEYGTTVEGQIGLNNVASYNAGTGYDLATGLGTIDAAKLFTNWGNVRSAAASTTTLIPSSSTFTHGTAITVAGAVSAAAGGATPTGNVALITSSAEYAEQGQAILPLTSGAFSQIISFLPGGSYSIWGYYPGDGTTPSSSSTPVSINVAPEASTTTLSVYSTATGGVSSGVTNIAYGNSFSLNAQPLPVTSASGYKTAATGTVAFADNSTPISNAVINTEGSAAYSYAFAPGAHSLTAAFSGDNSYLPSTSAAFPFSVVKDIPSFTFNSHFYEYSLYAGQVNVLPVELVNSNYGGLALPPTGTVTVSGLPGATTALSASLFPNMFPGSQSQSGALFTIPANALSGHYVVTFSYPGDANYASASASFNITLYSAAFGLSSSISASASAAATSPAAAVLASATVTGQSGHPTPTGYVYFESGGYDIIGLYLPISSANSVTASVAINSSNLLQGLNELIVHYSGDANYQPSQTTLTIDNSLSDFSLIPLSTIVTMPSSGIINQIVNISSNNGFAGPVLLTCAGVAGITCSIVPSVSLASGTTVPATLTVNTAGVTAAGTYQLVVSGLDSTGADVHTIGLQVVTPLVTTARKGPVGNLDLAVDSATRSTTVSQADVLFVSGWAADPVDGAPLSNVKIYLDGILLATPTLGLPRPDVATAFGNSAYTNSGFKLSSSASNLYVGPHMVQMVATDAAGFATTFNTLNITVTPVAGPPFGNIEMVGDNLTGSTTVSRNDLIAVNGWVADPADGSPVANVKIYIDGTSLGSPTVGIARPDVAAYFHNKAYARSGFAFTYYAGNLTPGSHTVSVVATDSGQKSTTFGPTTITLVAPAGPPPVGNLERAVDSVTEEPSIAPSGTLYVGGWAADYHDNGSAKSVQIFVDGTAAGFATLGESRPDVASYYNNLAWIDSGYSFNMSVAALGLGSHTITTIATDSLGMATTFGPISFKVSSFISTVTGDGIVGYNGDGGPATSAQLNGPAGVLVDTAGNIYISDIYDNVVRKVTPGGVITTVAGTGKAGYSGDGGLATSATLSHPENVVVDASGNLYIADSYNAVIREVTPDGNIRTFAGTGSAGHSGDGGAATEATLHYPTDIKLDSGGNLYIVDTDNCVIRKVTSAAGKITTIAGNGTCGYSGDGGSATAAELDHPFAIAFDSSGNLFIADTDNVVVRKVTLSTGTISTVAGDGTEGYSGDGGIATNAELFVPRGVAVDGSGNLYISDSYNHRIREVTPAGTISTAVGDGTEGYSGDGGPATDAEISYPYRLAFDYNGNLYIAVEGSSVVRKVAYSGSSSSSSTPAVRPVLLARPRAKAAGLLKPAQRPVGKPPGS